MVEDYASYIKAYAQRLRRRRLQRQAAYAAARRQAQTMAEVLTREFGVARVFLIGTLADPERFDEHSGIDLAVEGLAPEKYLAAWRRLEEIASRPFDLITLETAPAPLREEVLAKGILLSAADR